jgi:class 3 adenylate cyclase/tetratricopeptide (TPR) repeat protein
MMFCQECGHGVQEGAKFCPECGTRLAGGRPAVEQLPVETRRTVTVLFIDVTGSTPLGERLDPEAVRRILSRYFGEVATIVARHGGTLEKFAGDALVAVFGLPVLHEDDALRAVRAAGEARSALAVVNDELIRDYGLGLDTRTGVNTGEVVGGDSPTGSTLATGDMVNVAARLEQRAQPGEIVIGEATYRLVRDAITVEELEPLELKGKSELVSAYRVVDIAPDAPGLARRLESPIVGRSLELAELLEAFDETLESRTSRVASILGEAGAGKSRLVRELVSVVGERAAVLEGRCVPYGEGITYFPLAIMLKPLAEIADEDTRDAARRKLLALLPDTEESSLVVARLAGAIGLDDVLARPEEIAWAVRRLLESLAHERPIVVVFDDLHWAEPTFLRLVQYLGEHCRDAPVLVVGCSRPELTELAPALFELPGLRRIELESLADLACATLIGNLLGDNVSPEIAARVAEVAEGNPLFIEETVRMLLDEGLIAREGERWKPARNLADVVLPPSIEALLAARLDRLEPAELAVVQRGAVIGRIFSWAAVRAISPEEEQAAVAGALEALLRKEVVFRDAQALSGAEAYRFGHILVRDAAYKGLPKEKRAELHERAATFLEESTGDRAAEYEELIGYHLEQAFGFRAELGPVNEAAAALRERAHVRLASAGHRSLLRGDLPAALNLFRRAAALAAGESDKAELLTRISGVLVQLGQFAEADALLEQALDQARADGDELREAHASVAREFVLLQTDPAGRSGKIVDVTERVVPLFEAHGDDYGLARAWRLRSEVGRLVCRFGEEAAALERARVHAEAAGEERESVEIKLWLANCLCYGPTPVGDALAQTDQMLEQAHGVRWVQASLLGMRGYLLAMADRPDEARAHQARSHTIFEELGMSFANVARAVIPAGIEQMAGDLGAAERELVFGHDQLEAIGENELRSTIAAALAHVLYEQDRDDEAEVFARASKSVAAEDDIGSQVLWRSALAKVIARRDGSAEAEELASDAVALAATTDMLSLHGAALLDLARVEALRNDGRPPEHIVEEAIALFERKEDAASLRRAALEFAGTRVSSIRA